MSRKNTHTVRHPDRWANRREANERVFNEHLIHRRDGTIGERNSYGHDPYPSKG